MIQLTLVPNAFEPAQRSFSTVDGVHTLGSLVPDDWAKENRILYIVNGTVQHDPVLVVGDDDAVIIAGGVDGLETIILIVLAAASLAAAALTYSKLEDLEDALANPDQSDTYGYYGLRNNYRAEGDSIPVVYGSMRVAGPCINQSVVGDQPATFAPGATTRARREVYIGTYIISHGPIEGIGRYLGPVSVEADQRDLVEATGYSPLEATGLQINKIRATSFVADLKWRTGTAVQSAISNFTGPSRTSDIAATYEFNLRPENGVNTATLEGYGSGFVAYANRIIADAAEYVSHRIDTLSTRAIFQITYPAMFTQNTSNGNFSSRTQKVRYQYWETDSSGNRTSDPYVSETISLTGNSISPISFDRFISFFDPATFNAGQAGGFAFCRPVDDHPSGISSVYDANYPLLVGAAGAGNCVGLTTGPTPSFTYMGWVSFVGSPNGVVLFSWSDSGTDASGFYGGGLTDGGYYTSTRGTGFQLIRRFNGNIDGEFRVWGDPACEDGSFTAYSVWTGKIADSWEDIEELFGQGSFSNVSAWAHLAVTFDGSYYSESNGTPARVRACLNGAIFVNLELADNNVRENGPLHCRPQHPVNTSFGPARISIGRGAHVFSPVATGRIQVADFVMVGRALNESTIIEYGSPSLYTFQHPNVSNYPVKSKGSRDFRNDPYAWIVLPMDRRIADASGNAMLRNHAANPGGAVAMVSGDFQIDGNGNFSTDPYYDAPGSGLAQEGSGAPVAFGAKAEPKRAYWQVEIFLSTQINESDKKAEGTIESIVAYDLEPYSYPGIAHYLIEVAGNDQIANKTPIASLLVRGKHATQWDGSVDSDGLPILTERYTRNPAWVAADLLCNDEYGLGGDVGRSRIDWPSFKEWADYCDEGVPDGFGEYRVFGIKIETNPEPFDRRITLRVALVGPPPDYGQVQTLPNEWRPQDAAILSEGSSLSIIEAKDIDDEFVTKNDTVGGLNDASSKLPILSIDIEYDSTGTIYGCYSWAEITLRWQRYDENGDSILPTDWGTSIGGFNLSEDQTTDYIFKIAGYEERALFDGTFDQRSAPAWEQVLSVFRCGRAIPIVSGQKIYASIRRPKPPVTLFTQANVIRDSLSLTYRNPKELPNSIDGEILDRYDNFEKATIQVDHPSTASSTESDAYRKERTQFFGVTRRSQAYRDARYLLNRYNLIRREIEFTAGPDAVFVFPGDRIRFAHDTPSYGVSGRLRSGSTATSNLYPGAGANLSGSFTEQGGPVSVSKHAVYADRSVSLPTVYIGSQQVPAWLKSAPMTDERAPLITQANLEDLGYEDGPTWYSQVIANATVLYPPNAPTQTLDQVVSSDYVGTFSMYVKEPEDGASDEIRLALYRIVDEDGVLIDSSYRANFRWLGGNLVFHSVVPSTGGVSGVATSAGNGWFRISVSVDNTLLATPFEVGDYIQARLYHGKSNAGVFRSVANGGRGLNFLYRGDPIYYGNGLGPWRAFNTATIGSSVANKPSSITNAPPPLYGVAVANGEVVDASFGLMALMQNAGSASNPTILRQEFTLPTGATVSTWNGENIHASLYARVSPTNTATGTTMHIDLRGVNESQSHTYNVFAQPNADGIRVNLSTSAGGGSWAVTSATRSTAFGSTVQSPIASVNPVRLNSTTTHGDWVRIDMTLNMTPASGNLTKMVMSIECDGSGTIFSSKELLLWNCRVHGDPTGGTITYYPYAHQGVLAWGAMYERSDAVTSYSTGSTLVLDRDVVTEAGKSYEVYLRSSSEADIANARDNVGVVYLDAQHIPATGTNEIPANTPLSCSEVQGAWIPAEGDIYSFGETGQSTRDYVVTSTSLEPGTLQTRINAEEYNEQVYADDYALTDIGLPVSSGLRNPNDESDDTRAFGVGYYTGLDGRYPDMALTATPIKDPEGGSIVRIQVRWKMPREGAGPAKWRFYLDRSAPRGIQQEGVTYRGPRNIGEVPCADELFEYDTSEFLRGDRVVIYCASVGTNGSASDWSVSRKLVTKVRTNVGPRALPIVSVSTTIRGVEQVYTLERFTTSRTFDVVEGRVGSWFFGQRAFLLDPSVGRVVSRAILTAPTNSSGEAQLPIVVRPRTRAGYFGRQTEVFGTENIEGVDYTYATAHEDAYSSGTAFPVDLKVSSGYIEFDSASTALTAAYTIDAIDLGRAQWVLPNVGMLGTQIRPETLGDLDFSFDSDEASRWSFEGPTDDLDDDNMTATIEWRYSTGSSITGSTWRIYEPGRVYARHLQYRVTFTRPTAAYNMRVSRLITQSLLLPVSDIDGGTY